LRQPRASGEIAVFITFEGGEGSGKSTQARALAERLRELGREVVLTREPGGTAFGEVARDILLHHVAPAGAEPFRLDETAELLIFAADRAQHLDELILPALERGGVVVCDRFADSTVAYQGYGRGIPLDLVQRSIDLATRGVRPDLTVLLDVPPELGMQRRLGERAPDQFEREALAFHTRVRDGFLALAATEPERFLVIDSSRVRDDVAKVIWHAVAQRLPIAG
jgi:dTMP kinase